MDLNFKVFGNGPPVIIAHGLLGSSRNWQSIGKALARENTVYIIDLRNHGDSPWSDQMTYLAMADDVIRLLDRQGIQAASLVGHSMGGKVAMAVALTAPSRVSRLSVLDIAPVTYAHDFDTVINAMLGLPLNDLRKRKDVEDELANALSDKNLSAFLTQNLGERAGELQWRINLKALAVNMHLITGWPVELNTLSFAGPAFFLRGSRSDYVTSAYEPKISALFPCTVIETIPGAGHWIHADAPAPTLAWLRSSLG